MSSRNFETDDDWEQINSTVQVDGDYYIIQGDIVRPRIEEVSDSEPESPKKQIIASDRSARRNMSESSSSQRNEKISSEDNNDKKSVKRESNQLALPHRSRALSQQGQRNLSVIRTNPTSLSTSPPKHRRTRSPHPYTNTPSPPTWQSAFPPQQPLQRQSPNTTTGHTYGAIYAAGSATVLMGNVGPANGNPNARSHSYGPVFTTGGARVYVGDVTSEEAARIFHRRN